MTTLDPAYEPDPDHSDDPGRDWDDSNADWRWEDRCPSLDPALCADGCGRLAETERPATGELVCRGCHEATYRTWLEDAADNRLTWGDL